MRIYEIASAEEQLGLFRIIIDNTWKAIAQQAAEQRKAESQRKATDKLKPSKREAGTGKAARLPTLNPMPPPPPPKPKPKTPNPQPPSELNSAHAKTQQSLSKSHSNAFSRLKNPSNVRNSSGSDEENSA